MVMSKGEWDALQRRLPAEDRMSYASYLEAEGRTAPPPSRLAAQESGTIGAASIARQQAEIREEAIQQALAEPMDITSRRYTQAAINAGLTPTPVGATGPINIPVFESGVTGPGIVTVTGPVPTTATTFIPTTATSPVPTTATGPTTIYTAPDGRIFTDLNAYNAYIAQLKAEEKRRAGQSAYDLLFEQFNQFGLGALIEPLKAFITEGLSKAEFTLRLRETDAYKKRFAANQARVQKGLRALSEAEYIQLEDQYQDVMRRYGLPENYYARGEMGRQEGFEKFIGGDVSPVELEDRIQTAQRRVINAAPEVTASLRSFYPEIGQGDLLAYFLDPTKAIENIKRKVTAAEIGGAATMAGLATGMARAEELGRYGVTGEQARQGFQTIAGVLPRGSQLAEIYKQSPYTQTTAEQEVFGLAGAAEAGRQRRKLTELETAAFSGQAGVAGGALARDRAGAI